MTKDKICNVADRLRRAVKFMPSKTSSFLDPVIHDLYKYSENIEENSLFVVPWDTDDGKEGIFIVDFGTSTFVMGHSEIGEVAIPF